MKLKFEAMQLLMGELDPNEMWAIYLMGLGKQMTEKVTKSNLTNIIKVLCKNLNWIEELQDDQDRTAIKTIAILTVPRQQKMLQISI